MSEANQIKLLKPTKLYTEIQINAHTAALYEDFDKRYEFKDAFSDLKEIVLHIDFIAIYVPVGERAAKLKGYDEQLSAAYTRLIRTARHLNIDVTTEYPDSNKRISGRINAIQMADHDRGDQLLKVIGDSPGDIGTLAQAAKNKIRQGGGAYSKTRRLFMLIEQQRQITRVWDETMTAILKWLNQHTDSPEHPDDPEILSDLIEARRAGGMAGLKDHGHDVYHGYKRTKDYDRWILTDEYKLWKKSW